jgi:hypothetical protein
LKITKLLWFYLFAAAEQLGGLAALYAACEVLVAPGALVRSTLEHCAHARRNLQNPQEPVEDRLAHVYLEELLSAEEAKKTAGRPLGKDSEQHLLEKIRCKDLKAEVQAIFPEPTTDDHGRPQPREDTPCSARRKALPGCSRR